MLKNRSFNVKMVKDDKDIPPAEYVPQIDFDKADKVVREYAWNLAVGFVSVYAAKKTIDTISTVIINASRIIR